MKKIAFLILAHTDPIQLHRTVEALDDEHFDIYIHIDKKKPIEEFKLNELELKHSKIFVISNRRNVIWGDISIVEATLEMYQEAYRNYKYVRYVTMSGLDYPILSNQKLFEALHQTDVEYIGGGELRDKALLRVDWPFFWKNNICYEISRHIVMFDIPYRIALFLRRGKHKKLVINGKNAYVYFAPQWHALSGEFVSYMLETLRENPSILRYFKHSFAPDEMLIPTLMYNSEFAENATKFECMDRLHYNDMCVTHFINYRSQVEIFDENYYADIIKSGKMFTRKVNSSKSGKLVNMIEDYRNGCIPNSV